MLTGVVDYESYGLPDLDMCIQGYLKAVIDGEARRVVEITFLAYRDL